MIARTAYFRRPNRVIRWPVELSHVAISVNSHRFCPFRGYCRPAPAQVRYDGGVVNPNLSARKPAMAEPSYASSEGSLEEYTGGGANRNGAASAMVLLSRKITEKTILQVLVAGFILVLLIMLITGLVGIRSLRSIRASGNELVLDLRLTSNLIAQAQRQFVNLSAVTHRLAKAPEAIDSEGILQLVDEADRNLARIAAAGAAASQDARWRELETASKSLSGEIRRSLELEDVPIAATGALFQKHQQFISVVSELINSGYRRAVRSQAQIEAESQRFSRETLYAIIGCFLLAVLFVVLTLRVAVRLIRRMEAQTGELSRASWQILQKQETIARSLSHELHDELGQSLTAVKANLAVLNSSEQTDHDRLRDCLALVDESIQNVREMSQLFHPRMPGAHHR